MAAKTGKLNVFVSYSRDDLAFADQLRAALLAYDFAVTIDRESITTGEDWRKRLAALIRDADTIVFMLSPSSAGSPVCAWEAEEAVRLGKRIVPVVCRSIEGVAPPPQLASLQYTYFYDEPKFPGSGFGTGLNDLRLALNTDPDWVREHTRYLRLAKEWEDVDKPSDRRLLSAADILLAKAWMDARPAKAAPITALQLDFIETSEDEDARRKHAEAQRLREIAAAKTREAEAQRREAVEARRVVQRTLAGLVVAIVLAIASLGLAFVAYQQRQAALQATATAETERNRAVKATERADGQRELAEQATKAANTERDNAVEATRTANEQRNRANEALVEAIQSGLVFDNIDPPHTSSRARNALWALARSEDVIKSSYLRILQNDPSELRRVAGGFALVYSAAAMGRLPPEVLAKLAEVVVDNISKVPVHSTASDSAAELGSELEELRLLTPPGAAIQIQAAINLATLKVVETDDQAALVRLAQAIEALAPKLSDAQVQATIKSILDKIQNAKDSSVFPQLARTVIALSPKLSDDRVQAAINPILEKMQRADNRVEQRATAGAIEALASKLSGPQARVAIKPMLNAIEKVRDAASSFDLVQAIAALFPKLADAEIQAAIKLILGKIRNDADALNALAKGIAASPHAQAQVVIKAILDNLKLTDSFVVVNTHAQAIVVLSPRLSDVQAGAAVKLMLDKIQSVDEPMALQPLVQGIAALSPRLSAPEVQVALRPIVDAIQKADSPALLGGLAQAIGTLSPRLPDAQVRAAIDSIFIKLLPLLNEEYTPGGLETVASSFLGIAPLLSRTQAQAAIGPILKKFRTLQDANELARPLGTLAKVMAALCPKLSDAQAQAILQPILDEVKELQSSEQFSDTLGQFANVLRVLAPKLAITDAERVSNQARAALAWSSTPDEAAAWSRALIALLNQAADPNKMQKLVAAVGYPTAAGKATEVLLDAIEGGSGADLSSLAARYPEVLQPPNCPDPLKPFETSGLKCPNLARASSTLPSGRER